MGQGFATEAAAALLEFVRGSLRVANVMAWPAARNAASARVAEKIGLVRGGFLPDRHGTMHAVYILPHMQFDKSIAAALWGL